MLIIFKYQFPGMRPAEKESVQMNKYRWDRENKKWHSNSKQYE